MRARLGVNLGFATNRYRSRRMVAHRGEELGLRTVMFSADLLSMFYPPDLISEEVARINALAAATVSPSNPSSRPHSPA